MNEIPISLVLLSALFLVGDKVLLKKNGSIGQVVQVHLPHGHHTQAHYLVNWETGKDSGYSQFLYEFLLEKR